MLHSNHIFVDYHQTLGDMVKFTENIQGSNGISLARNSAAFDSCLNKQLCHKSKCSTLNGRIGHGLTL